MITRGVGIDTHAQPDVIVAYDYYSERLTAYYSPNADGSLQAFHHERVGDGDPVCPTFANIQGLGPDVDLVPIDLDGDRMDELFMSTSTGRHFRFSFKSGAPVLVDYTTMNLYADKSNSNTTGDTWARNKRDRYYAAEIDGKPGEELIVYNPDRDDIEVVAARWETYPRWFQDGMRFKYPDLR